MVNFQDWILLLKIDNYRHYPLPAPPRRVENRSIHCSENRIPNNKTAVYYPVGRLRIIPDFDRKKLSQHIAFRSLHHTYPQNRILLNSIFSYLLITHSRSIVDLSTTNSSCFVIIKEQNTIFEDRFKIFAVLFDCVRRCC